METRKVGLEVDGKKGKKAIDDIGKSAKETAKDVGQLEEKTKDVGKAGEKAGDGFKKGSKGTSVFKKGIKGIGVAMKGLGIGAIIAFLVRMAQVFGENQKVADAFAIAMELVSVVTNKFIGFASEGFEKLYGFIKDVFESPGKYGKQFADAFKGFVTDKIDQAIKIFGLFGSAVKKILKGDLDGAFEDVKEAGKTAFLEFTPAGLIIQGVKKGIEIAKKAIKTIVAESKAAVASSIALVEAKKAAAKAEADLETIQLRNLILSEKQRQIRDNNAKSITARISANKELGKILEAGLIAEKKAAQAAILSAKLQAAKTGNDEDQIALQRANNKLLEIAERLNGQKSEQLVNEVALTKELNELNKSKVDTMLEVSNLEAQAIIDAQTNDAIKLELQQAFIDAKYQQDADALAAELLLHEEGTQAYQDILNRQALLEAGYATSSIDLDKQRIQSKDKALSQLQGIFGAESSAGKAAVVAKQLLAAQELLIDLGVIKSKATKAITTATLDGAESGGAVASGLAQTLKLGFPAAIPALIGYAATAAGIISAVISAIGTTKKVAGAAGGGGGGGGGSAPQAPTIAPPSFNTIGSSNASQISDSINGQQENRVVLVNDDLETMKADNKVVSSNTELG